MKKANKKLICFAVTCQFLIVTFITSFLLSVKANEIRDEIHISVSDSTGEKTSFNYSVSNPNFISENDIVLKGESYGSFSINPSKYNTLQYKIVKSITDNSIINSEEGWKDINLNEQKNNNDVMIDKKGFLKHKSYDVNHLDVMKDPNKWNDEKEVYKTNYPGTSIISAKKTLEKDKASYGKTERYLKEGKSQTRWVNNTIFLEDSYIGDNYKEASKIWGYIKVDQDGEYNFQSFSDDGLAAYIIVNGETHKIVDKDVMFKLHGKNGISYKYNKTTRYGYEYGYKYELVKQGNNNYDYKISGSLKNVELKKDKYYPIYIEYFNWGGGAAFEMNFKKAGESYSSYRQIPASNFYPSKSDYPGEYADSIFTGADGIKLPEESGRYYIAYRAVSKDSTGKIVSKGEIQGTLGPYLVEPRAKLNISRDILSVSGKEVPLSDNKYKIDSNSFKIRYNVKPLPISLEELIADPNIPADIDNAPETYTMKISDSQIVSILPDGLDYANISENSVVEGKKSYNIINMNSIVYKLDKKNRVYNPVTKEAIFTHTIKAEGYGEYNLSEEYSKLTYKDVDMGNRELKFTTKVVSWYNNTDIIENVLYDVNTDKKQVISDKTVIKTMLPSSFALKVKINSLTPKVNIKFEGIEKGKIEFLKYELNSNGKINKATRESKVEMGSEFNLTKGNSFKMDISKEYLIVYKITPLNNAKSIKIIAIDEKGNEIIKQTIKTERPPILK